MNRVLFVAFGMLACWQTSGAAGLLEGKALYAVCAGCHGFQAEGNQAVGAPKLTGLDSVYMARQLRYFEEGARGGHEADLHGQRMAPFALALEDGRAIEDVVSYIETLPHERPAPTLAGDAERGGQSYALCAACHGLNGQGNAQLSAPALTGLDDWYMVSQLELYRAGARGADPADTYGQQMRPIVGTLRDEQQLLDLAAYIGSLE
jgi:cytochrome c oxidase subunit 2